MNSKKLLIAGVASMLLGLIAIGSYIAASGAGVWNGKALSATFSDGTNNITSSVDIEGKRLRFDILMDDGHSMMTILSTNGLDWIEFMTQKERVGNETFEFVHGCKVLAGEDAEMLPPPSSFFPDEGNGPAVAANGSKLSVNTSNKVLVTLDLEQGFLSAEKVSVRDHGEPNMSLTSYDFSALNADTFQLPGACSGDDMANEDVMAKFQSASEKQLEADLDRHATNLSSSNADGTRRLAAPWNKVAGTNYCGAQNEGGGGPRNSVDRCCAFHDFKCGYNQQDTGHSLGAGNSARNSPSWFWGQHGGKAEHCSCAGALAQCALAALWTDVPRGDWEGVWAGLQVFTAFSHLPCWFNVRFCFPYPCGWHCWSSWWWFDCRVKWCCWNVVFPVPTRGGRAPPYVKNVCTNPGPVIWTSPTSATNCEEGSFSF